MESNYLSGEQELAATIKAQDIAYTEGLRAYGMGSLPLPIYEPAEHQGVRKAWDLVTGNDLHCIGSLQDHGGRLEMHAFDERHLPKVERMASQLSESLDIAVDAILRER